MITGLFLGRSEAEQLLRARGKLGSSPWTARRQEEREGSEGDKQKSIFLGHGLEQDGNLAVL